MSTLTQLQTELLLYGFDSTAYTTRITTWLNEAQRHIARALDLPQLEKTFAVTVVAGTAEYALPADFLRLLYAFDNTLSAEFVLLPITYEEFQDRDTTQRGQPTNYYIVYNSGVATIGLWPTPDKVYLIAARYVAVPTAMAAPGDLSGFSADWDDVLKAYVLSEAYAAEDDANMSQFWFGRYKEKLVSMGEDLMGVDHTGPHQVPGAWNF